MQYELNTLGDLLQKAEQFLERKGVQKPRLEAQIIFAASLNLERIQLYTQDDRPLTESEILDLRKLLVRKGDGEPTAYLTGGKEFYGRKFTVNTHTLIPRPETEELCDLVLSNRQHYAENLKILDLATGTGCIGITTALELQKKGHSIEHLYLLDISEFALEVASLNATLLEQANIPYELQQSDWFSSFTVPAPNSIDLIISNPPYVFTNEYEKLDATVKNFEPEIALHAANLDEIITKIANGAKKYLKPEGFLYIETNPAAAAAGLRILNESGFKQTTSHTDLAGREHFISGRN